MAANRKGVSDIPGPEDRTVIRSGDEADENTPPRPKYEPPYMVVVDGPRAGAHFPLSEGPNIIGRSIGCAIRLEDQSVSRQHVEILKGDSGWMVKDLGSKNGTTVNGNSVTDPVIIGHKDIVKAGIYQLRLITQPTSLEEEMKLPPTVPSAVSDRTVFVSAPPDGQTASMDATSKDLHLPPKEEVSGGEPPPGEATGGLQIEERPARSRRQLILLSALGVVLIATAAYFANKLLFSAKKPAKSTTSIEKAIGKPKSLPPEGQVPGTPPGQPPAPGEGTAAEAAAQQVPAPPPVQKVPVFLDFASSPMPVGVTFQEENLGVTPIRVNVELEPDKAYQAEALFDMPEIQEKYTQTLDFNVEKGKSVIPILFRGPIGMIKINDLPRDVEFYLEGKFTYDRFQERSAKLTEIVLQKPIYIPYGEYFMELRRVRQMGETSQTFVSDIIFRRDFTIAEESPTFVLGVTEEDLGVFPVKIRSEPENADVYVDGKKVGKTPYEGLFPIAKHRLSLRKEGYFEHSEDLEVDINTPFVANVKMKTSVAGAHINNAKLAMDRQMYQEAVNELAEALNSDPAPSEIAKANYMLGVCYLSLNDIQRAMGYFEQAKEDEELRYPAMLGLVNGYAMMQRIDKALPILVEVLLKAKDEQVKREANDLFQKISPFRSVIYIYSEPSGAQVLVNGKAVEQKTPVILHELPLGSYKIHIEKAGYQPTDLNLSLSVNEFNPVIVKLKPIPQ